MAFLSSIKASKQIPSVQKLTQETLVAIVQRYVPDALDNPVFNCCNPSLQVPLVNIAIKTKENLNRKSKRMIVREGGDFK
ncbi:hypothetical protein MRB53_005477 [Persea americana]|uniref:Uncharacterized protein n=1 Tax=Persea americana TaxID=3435 RepID=A0ACC2MDM0_PERAE|nr:hypothetical protein MRB53_005477 [Persea americana]